MIEIATIKSPYKQKFGIPRQSGMEKNLFSEIVFKGEFNNPDCIKGIEEYSHLYVIWGFSENKWQGKLTVKPPRLGGKESKGVFATRSSFRPNGLGLSIVKIEDVIANSSDVRLIVSGGDMLDGTPVYDIKPYLPYADAHPEAKGSFGQEHNEDKIEVIFPESLQKLLPEHLRLPALNLIKMDPRAAFNKKPDYLYGLALDEYDIRFKIEKDVATVVEIVSRDEEEFSKVKQKT